MPDEIGTSRTSGVAIGFTTAFCGYLAANIWLSEGAALAAFLATFVTSRIAVEWIRGRGMPAQPYGEADDDRERPSGTVAGQDAMKVGPRRVERWRS